MRTTIQLSDDLMASMMRESKSKTVTQAIREAVQEYLKHKKRLRLIKSFGRRSAASVSKPSLSVFKPCNGLHQVIFSEFRPEFIKKIEFSICHLPQKKVGNPFFTARPYQ